MSGFLDREMQGGGGGGTVVSGNDYIDLPVDGGVKNGNVGANIINNFPFIEYFNLSSGFGSVAHNISVPSNFNDSYALPVTLYWSATDNTIGNVNWSIEYNAFIPNTSNILSASNTIGVIQPTIGNNGTLLSTGTSLSIPSVPSNSSLIFLNIKRLFNGNDTYNNSVRLHLVRIQYTAK